MLLHTPVLLEESLKGLLTGTAGWYVDGTAGAGGHSFELLSRLGADGRLLALDQDAMAIDLVRERLKPFGDRARIGQSNFSQLKAVAEAEGIESVQGVLLDLGVSSMQLDRAERGFSFMHPGPLDMRMDARLAMTAADVLRFLPEKELATVLWRYGEESAARRIAAAVTEELRRGGDAALRTTDALADLVVRVKGRKGRIHPATQTFQALRIYVNGELDVLEEGLEAALNLLAPGGRLAVITFHSLEDRMVKKFMVAHEGRMEALARGGSRWAGELPRGRRVTRKPIVPSETECDGNPRARSAKLRILERLVDDGKTK